MQRSHRLWHLVTIAMAMMLLVPTVAAATVADTHRSGAFTCRASATKLGDEITITFTLHTTRADRHWLIRIWDKDVLLLSRSRITSQAGNIRVRIGAENLPGPDVFRFRAANRGSGSSCRVEDLRV